MDIRQLTTFMEVAKTGSFSKAAEKLYLTQPTVTNHVHAIEKEFNAVLINRMSKEISLTDAGRIVYANSLDIINSYKQMKHQLDAYKGKIEGKLEIASSSVPRKHLLPELIAGFKRKYPKVIFSVIDVDSSMVVQRILDGYIDFGFVGAVYENANLEYLPVLDDHLVLASPPDTLEKDHKEGMISIRELVELPIILREQGSGTGKVLVQALDKIGLSPDNLNISAQVADTEFIKRMISLGTGSSFLSYRDVYDPNGKKTFETDVYNVASLDLHREFYMVFHKKRKLSPLGEAFKDFTLDNL